MPSSEPPNDPNSNEQTSDNSASLSERKFFGFSWRYWNCNFIEMWERLAYYTLRPVAPIYIMQADEGGGLHLTAQDKGFIYMIWAFVQSMLPMVTGGYADRYGYKRTLFFSITLNIIGYVLMAAYHSYTGFLVGVIVLAIGTAFFKPSLQATLAHNLTKANSSLGWGIFYWIVNVGSLMGHYLSPLVLVNHDVQGWRMLFLVCAGFTALNYLLLLTYSDVPSGASKTVSPLRVLWHTLANLWDARLLTWLAIMSCFWLMMFQLWDLQPNFITDWIDSSMVAEHVPFERFREIGDDGKLRVPQQVLLSLNAALIVCLMIPVAWAVRKMRTLSVMAIGMFVCTGGVLVAGLTHNGWMLLLGIVLFSLGEMLTGPKKNEYLGLIAPPGKKGLYLGYVNIPIGVGVGCGSWIAGQVYGNFGEKAMLALRYLAERTPFGQGKGWDGRMSSLEATLGVSRPEAFAKLQEVLQINGTETTRLLWNTYDPQYAVWIPFAAIGAVATIALIIFGQMAKRWKDMNA